jgi:hypothetical protein
MHEVLTVYRRQRIATRRRHWIAAWWWRWQGRRIRRQVWQSGMSPAERQKLDVGALWVYREK